MAAATLLLNPHQSDEYQQLLQFENEIIVTNGTSSMSTTVGWMTSMFGKSVTMCAFLNDHATNQAQITQKNFISYRRCHNVQYFTRSVPEMNPMNYDQQRCTLVVVPSHDFEDFHKTAKKWCPSKVVSAWKTFTDVKYNFPVALRTFRSGDASPTLFSQALTHKNVDILIVSCTFLLGYKKHLSKMFWNRIVVKKGMTHEPLNLFTNRVMTCSPDYFPTNFVWLLDRFIPEAARHSQLDFWAKTMMTGSSTTDYLNSLVSHSIPLTSIMVRSPIERVMSEHGATFTKSVQGVLDPKKFVTVYASAGDLIFQRPGGTQLVPLQQMIESRRWLDMLGFYCMAAKTSSFEEYFESYRRRFITGLQRLKAEASTDSAEGYQKTIDQISQRVFASPNEACPICLETDKPPVLLSCLHFVCAECCIRLSVQTASNKIVCPCCRTSTHNTYLSRPIVRQCDIDHEQERLQRIRDQEAGYNLSFVSVEDLVKKIIQNTTFDEAGDVMLVIGSLANTLAKTRSDRFLSLEGLDRVTLAEHVLQQRNPIILIKAFRTTSVRVLKETGVRVSHVVCDESINDDSIHFFFAEKSKHMHLIKIGSHTPPSYPSLL